MASEDDRYLLRDQIAQELRRIIDRVVLNSSREISVVLKPAAGYGAQIQFRDNRLEMLRFIDLDTEDVTEVPRILFLKTQHYMLSEVI
jgi:hypothetical protein